jgi:hypothetical protein
MLRSLALLTLLPFTALAQALPEPGDYECRIDKGYKFKPCTVRAAEHGVELEIPGGGLIGVTGRLYSADAPKTVVLVGRLNEEAPWGCYQCNAGCRAQPETCECKEIMQPAQDSCKAQTITGTLKKVGKAWAGSLTLLFHSAKYTDGKVVGHDIEGKLFDFQIRPVALVKPKK